jgi:hypothetical protein
MKAWASGQGLGHGWVEGEELLRTPLEPKAAALFGIQTAPYAAINYMLPLSTVCYQLLMVRV